MGPVRLRHIPIIFVVCGASMVAMTLGLKRLADKLDRRFL